MISPFGAFVFFVKLPKIFTNFQNFNWYLILEQVIFRITNVGCSLLPISSHYDT